MREMLKIMGVSDSALMGSWYVLQRAPYTVHYTLC
jgi:hypothetical protein